ncbi:cubilin-like [Ciona intestinalis]
MFYMFVVCCTTLYRDINTPCISCNNHFRLNYSIMKSIGFILFLAVYSGCSDDDDVRVDSRVSTEQSRMYTNNGHLFFEAGGGFNISFKTKQGRVNINDKDLDVVTTQVTQNQLDITDIKQNGGMSPGAVNQIDNNTKLIGELKQSLEDQHQLIIKLESTVGV